MKLLVSVASVADATAALAGVADIIDAKNPLAGALGAVPLDAFRAIRAAIGGQRIVSAALGDGADAAGVEDLARAFADAGADYVKVGFAGIADQARVEAMLCAAVRGVLDGGQPTSAVIAV